MPLSRQHRPIIAFGDSLVEGLGASKNRDWVSLLSARYHSPILNKGRKHDTTRSALSRLEKDVIHYHPRLTILLLGGNDILFRIPKKETFLNLSYMIDRIQIQEIGVLLLGIRGGILVDAFEGKFHSLAEEKGIPCIPNILEDILDEPGLMTDPLHPNDEGHQIIADRIESMLGQVDNPIDPKS
ncbi:MAG: arylesterase [Nitrospirota bacterium]|nr:MAG: arylesterase [Nitrospirota bacterium]